MTTTFKLPKKIRVGYQERDDTYSGKLAYALSLDKRKEMPYGWKRWCDDKLGHDDFDNEPMEGFVLNRDVGGTQRSYSWNARRERVRVYDPRGFEIEITVDNLLLILQECSSIKGKGIEGELVYAWDGSHVGLLPICSQEYKEASKRLELRDKKITKKDMVEGCIYRTKKNEEWMYMGRQNYYQTENRWRDPVNKRIKRLCVKKHVFRNMDESGKDSWGYELYIPETGFTKLAEKVSDSPEASYADYYDHMMKQEEYSQVVGLTHKKAPEINLDRWNWSRYSHKSATILFNDEYYYCIFPNQESHRGYFNYSYQNLKPSDYKLSNVYKVKWDEDKAEIVSQSSSLHEFGLKTLEDVNDKIVVLKTIRDTGNKYDLIL